MHIAVEFLSSFSSSSNRDCTNTRAGEVHEEVERRKEKLIQSHTGTGHSSSLAHYRPVSCVFEAYISSDFLVGIWLSFFFYSCGGQNSCLHELLLFCVFVGRTCSSEGYF